MNDPIQLFINLIQMQPCILSVCFSLFVGYVLKLIPSYPNSRIPVAAIGASIVAYLILCVPPAGVHDSPINLIRYLLATLIIGCMVGMFAWMFHAQLLKRFEEKLPFIGDKLKNNNTPPTP